MEKLARRRPGKVKWKKVGWFYWTGGRDLAPLRRNCAELHRPAALSIPVLIGVKPADISLIDIKSINGADVQSISPLLSGRPGTDLITVFTVVSSA